MKDISKEELNSHILHFKIEGCFYCNYTFFFEGKTEKIFFFIYSNFFFFLDSEDIYFAKEKGLLFLTKKIKKQLNVSIYQKNITWENDCFGK